MATDQSIKDGDSPKSIEDAKSGSFKSFNGKDQNARFTFADRGD